MMNLFGETNKPKTINVALFTDERKNIAGGWNYISTIVIPTKKFEVFYDKLVEHRKTKQFEKELKFADIKRKGTKQELSGLWLNELLHDKEQQIYFSVLGVDTNLLDNNKFGAGELNKAKNYANFYNRFFRTTVLSVKFFFKEYDQIIIDEVFHDSEGNLESHEYFNWHLISKVGKDEKITFQNDNIVFVNSDHEKEEKHPKASQIIQLSDILVGTITHCLDFESTGKKHEGKHELGKQFYPLVKRILKNPKNMNSKYNYYRKYDINFFPTEVSEEYKDLKQYLHKNKLIKIQSFIDKEEDKKHGQQTLNF